MKIKEVIAFLSEAKNHTYSSEDKYYLSKTIDTLYRMEDLTFYQNK